MARFRFRRNRRRAATAAYAGGLLLVLSGGTGAVALVSKAWTWLSQWFGEALFPLFLVVLAVAGLGGFSVVAGGYFLEHHNRHVGKVLIGLGSGMGLLGLVLHFVVSGAAGENPVIGLVSVHGAGVLLAIYAQVTG